MKVVDVTRLSIVAAPPKCRYVTLSYVWGGAGATYWTTKANRKKRRIWGGLDASILPATISDTIELVRQLGERYLWIDALCIVQDDHKDKEVQIGVMDLIYGNSVFTIFAVNNISVQDPLPGVRKGTRDHQQHIVKIQGLHLAVPFNHLHDTIENSVWNQRGWTYQEFVLSRRRIFLTADQVHFECVEGNWCEGVVAELVSPLSAERYRLIGGCDSSAGGLSALNPSSWHNQAYLRDYAEIINTYTKRKLTEESDIINAIMALLKALTRAYKLADGDYDKAFRFGMPVVNLTEALLWQPVANAPHARRSVDGTGMQWPSWTWAGWRGAARYSSVSVFVNLREEPDKNIFIYETLVQKWYIVDDNGHPVAQGTRLDLDGHTGEDMQDAGLSMYVVPDGDINPEPLINKNTPLRPGTLVFRTSSARFNVKRARDVAGARTVADYAIYSILMDTPRPSTLIGRVILPSSTSSPASQRFIVLARADRCKGLYEEDVFQKPYHGCMMYVMAVQETQYEGIVERVGVGIIFEQAWLKSTTEQDIVLLG